MPVNHRFWFEYLSKPTKLYTKHVKRTNWRNWNTYIIQLLSFDTAILPKIKDAAARVAITIHMMRKPIRVVTTAAQINNTTSKNISILSSKANH